MSGEGEEVELHRVLPELKRRGCTILVTGEVNPTVSMRASRRMFGEVTGSRTRVVGLTRQAAMRPDAWLPEPVTTETDRVELVELAQPSRLTTGVSSDQDRIDEVTDRMMRAVDTTGRGDRHGPGQFRVGVYSLLPLEGRYGTDAIESFIRDVGDRVRTNGGMGHFHLPRNDEDAIVDRIDEHVDVRVELRQLAATNPTPEQRWHVEGSASRWVTL